MNNIELTITESPISVDFEFVEAKIKPEQTKSVTPTYEQQRVLPDVGMTLGEVIVNPIPDPTATLEITENGTYNVARIGSVDVNVPVPPNYMEKPNPGAWYSDYDEDGYPHTFTIRGYSTTQSFAGCFRFPTSPPTINKYVENLNVYSNLNRQPYCTSNALIKRLYLHSDNQYFDIGNNQFSQFTNLETVICDCDVSNIGADAFANNYNTMLYDFSKNTAVPQVPFWQNGRTISHASGCVMRIPQRLLEEWQTVWGAYVTDVVWEGV